ncbi:WhiB family transcriptional regulator [Streptomyces olivaceoviridis]|uniref:WhiB family transcriptional regulator n=1 Tax=Streptomyces olivaceoviridis TaxID=1921 RepID=UPI0036B30522
MTSTEKSSEQLRREWVIHPHFRYRGCAPDPDDPMRMAGDPSLHVGAHNGPDAFLPEGQVERREREAKAIEVCLNCPVMVQCDAYASSVRPDGRLAEPEGVWGGRRALERHKALIAARHAVPAASTRRFQTAQKRAVLAALASCWDPFDVAEAAGMDVRTANWQRSSLVRLLGLPKDVSRMRALAVARERGLLEGVELVPDDGSVPAIPPPTRLPVGPQQLYMWGVEEFPAPVEVQPSAGRGVRSPSMRVKFKRVEGQEDLVMVEADSLAEVHEMFPAEIALEAAA